MYCFHPDMAQSPFQELDGESCEDLLVNVHTLTDLLHFTVFQKSVLGSCVYQWVKSNGLGQYI